MGFIDFVPSAGAPLFSDVREGDDSRAEKLTRHVRELGIRIEGLDIEAEGEVARVSGRAATQEAREKAILAVGNTEGIGRVEDRMTVPGWKRADQAAYYTVKLGDTLSTIALEHYGNSVTYPLIFEANRPLIGRPDSIYPGQVLRIPRRPGAERSDRSERGDDELAS